MQIGTTKIGTNLKQNVSCIYNVCNSLKKMDNMTKITIGTMSFSSRDAKFPTMIANKYGLSTESIHKLNGQDTRQSLSKQKSKIKIANQEGKRIRMMQQPNDKGAVFAVWTNKELDVFGFYKVILDDDVVKLITFGEKAYKLF